MKVVASVKNHLSVPFELTITMSLEQWNHVSNKVCGEGSHGFHALWRAINKMNYQANASLSEHIEVDYNG